MGMKPATEEQVKAFEESDEAWLHQKRPEEDIRRHASLVVGGLVARIRQEQEYVTQACARAVVQNECRQKERAEVKRLREVLEEIKEMNDAMWELGSARHRARAALKGDESHGDQTEEE